MPFCITRCGYCDFNTYTALELGGDVLRDELRVGLGLADLLHVDEHLVLRERLHTGELGFALGGGIEVTDLEDLDALATLADHHARASRVHDDLGLVGSALYLDARDVRVVEILLDRPLDADVFVEPLRVVLVLVPFAGPRLDDAEAKAIRMSFLSHYFLPLPEPRERLSAGPVRCGCG